MELHSPKKALVNLRTIGLLAVPSLDLQMAFSLSAVCMFLSAAPGAGPARWDLLEMGTWPLRSHLADLLPGSGIPSL